MDTRFIDLYCERSNQGFWDEPLNALSNLAILAAAYHGWGFAKKHQKQTDLSVRILIILSASIALGSFVFHTFATTWAQWADIIPIWSFVIFFAGILFYRIKQHNTKITVAHFVTIFVLILLVSKIFVGNLDLHTEKSQHLLNGSEHYTPAILFLIVFAGVSYQLKHPIFPYLGIACILFTLALVFRSIDLQVCSLTHEFGTHFLWHMTNGLLIAVLLRGLISIPKH